MTTLVMDRGEAVEVEEGFGVATHPGR